MKYYKRTLGTSIKEISKSTFYRLKKKHKYWITIAKDGNNKKVKIINL